MPRLRINADGSFEAIYSDELAPLLEQTAAPVICRVSDVEPDPAGGWTATMRDDGAKLGPYPLRQEALDAEVSRLERKLFT